MSSKFDITEDVVALTLGDFSWPDTHEASFESTPYKDVNKDVFYELVICKTSPIPFDFDMFLYLF